MAFTDSGECRRVVFSIATTSHVAQSMCLFESLGENVEEAHSATTDYILFVVGGKGQFDERRTAPVRCIHAEDVVDRLTLASLTRRYTPAEVCWALKPHLLAWTLGFAQQSFYFDGDILVTGGFAPLAAELGDDNLLLTPHYLTGFSHTPFGVNALSLLRGGVFNAGFIGLNSTDVSRQFLSWWAERVGRFGRNDPDNGMCGDQRWLDLAPTLFDGVKVSRHRGLNVGYWNLHERTIVRCDDRYWVDDDPLVFFHFSGFDPSRPTALSSHLKGFVADGALAALAADYSERLTCAKAKWGDVPAFYEHRRWWHRCVDQYRYVLDTFRNPRGHG
ncbi:hypothetical protein L3V59_03760 [Burkholderia aenigmatica]|uniref:hypothetical protein n=1 Tax=Burkholderia cepacia complex TaxID=87882 RepID=UPI0013DE6B04|nr:MULTISPECIES: hypothetical protein [Burkholderia cepacia complex]UKD12201.1 hypothetical protein L3V59_03760 [Burkholderia aenigmatica]